METYQYSPLAQLSHTEQWLWRLYNVFAQSEQPKRLYLRPYLEKLSAYYGVEELRSLYPHIVSMWERQGLPRTNYELAYHMLLHRHRVWDKIAGEASLVSWLGGRHSITELFERLEQLASERGQVASEEPLSPSRQETEASSPKHEPSAEGQDQAKAEPTYREPIITDWAPEDAILVHKYTLYFFIKSVFASIDSFTKWTLHEQELTLAIEQAQKSEYQEYMPHGLKPLSLIKVARSLGYIMGQDYGAKIYTFDLERGQEIERNFRFFVAITYCMSSKQIQNRWILPHAFSPAVRLALSLYREIEQVFDPRYTDQVHRFVRHIALQEGYLVQSSKAEHGRDDMLSWPNPKELEDIYPLSYSGTLERVIHLSNGIRLSGLTLFYLFKSLLSRSNRADGGVAYQDLKIRHQTLTPRYLGGIIYNQIDLPSLLSIAKQKQIISTKQDSGETYIVPSSREVQQSLVDGSALHKLVRLLFIISSKHRSREEAKHLRGIDALYPSILDIFANIPLPEDWRSFIYIAKQERWISYDEFEATPRLTLSQEVDPLLYELPLYEAAFVAIDAEGNRYTESGKEVEIEEQEANAPIYRPIRTPHKPSRDEHPIYKRMMSKQEGQPQLHEFCQITDIAVRDEGLGRLLIKSEPYPWTQLLGLVDRPEMWSFHDFSMTQRIVYQPKYNLARYIASLYTRISLSPKEKDRDYILKSKGIQVFNTGLFDKEGDQIYALFYDSHTDRQLPILLGFDTERSAGIGNHLFTIFAGKLPSLVPLHRKEYGELIYKPEYRTMVFHNCWKHIIHDRIDRLPISWIRERLPEGWMDLDPRDMTPPEQREYYLQLRERIKQDMDTEGEVFGRIKEDLQEAFSHSLRRAHMRKVSPISVYHKGDNRITFLFPISLEGGNEVESNRVDLVLAMNEDEETSMYVGVTILTLSWAYQSALQSHLSPQEWLSWELVETTAERHLKEGRQPSSNDRAIEPVTLHEGWRGIQRYQFFPPEPMEKSLSESLERVVFAEEQDYEQEEMLPTSLEDEKQDHATLADGEEEIEIG